MAGMHGDGKRSSSVVMRGGTALWFPGLLLGTLLVGPVSPAHANPQGGQVAAGQASITLSGNTLDIKQTTDKAVIDWRSFNIAPGELTAFSQPSASSMTLNRINDSAPSQILGTLTANGHVVLVNPNGVFFGPNSRVDVSGLVASTSGISNADFMNGKLNFSQPGSPQGANINQGTITAQDAGLVGLVAPSVENDGVITARLGKVALASGDSFTVDMAGDNLIQVAVTGPVAQQLASNTGQIVADGGTVMLTAAAGRQLVDGVVSNSGAVEANSIGSQNGHIVLFAEGSNAVPGNVVADKGQASGDSTALNSGILSASGNGSGEKGGTVEVLGDRVGLLSGSSINASGSSGGGTVRVGGDYHGGGTTPTASRTIVQESTTIRANALDHGDGGKVTVWSDDRTDFAGSIEAKGGPNGGNGGFVETSGKQLLQATGTVDASAAKGQAGTWLLDPNDITIQAAGSDTNASGDPNFTTTDDSSIVTTGSIDADLNAGTSVTITTASSGGNSQAGNITVADNIAKTAGGDATLTFSAASDITVNSNISISSTSGKLNTVFDADTAGNGGAIVLNPGSSITTNGGNITMGGQGSPATLPAVGDAANPAGISINPLTTLSAGGGNIVMHGQGGTAAAANNIGVLNSGTLQTSGDGNIALTGIGGHTADTDSYNMGVANGNYWTQTFGTIQVTGAGSGSITVTGTGSTGGRDVTGVMDTGLIQTAGSGNIAIAGTGGTGRTYYNNGIDLYRNSSISPAMIQATGTGSITLTGTGGGSTLARRFAGGIVGGPYAIQTAGGNITLTGNVPIPGWAHAGVTLSTGTIQTAGAGNIAITGTGGPTTGGGFAIGILNGLGNTIESSGFGNISLTGTGGSGANNNLLSGGFGYSNQGVVNSAAGFGYGPGIIKPGSATLTITGIGGSGAGSDNTGIVLNGVIGDGGTTGNSILRADSINMNGGTIQTTGNVSFQPYTTSTTIGVAGGAGSLGLTSGILNGTTAGSITIGSASDTGAMDVGAYSWNAPLTLLNGSGSIGIDGAQTMGGHTFLADTASGNITLRSGGSIASSAAGTAITLAASGGTVVNDGGGGALSAPDGRWLVYSSAPFNDALGGLSVNFRRYGCTYGSYCPSFPANGNSMLYSSSLPDTVSKGFSDVAAQLEIGQAQSTADSQEDYTRLITMDVRLGADLASPFVPGSKAPANVPPEL